MTDLNASSSSLAIVLVGPQMGENIGFVARAMLNFGLTDLRLVTPRDGWPNPKAEAPASGAIEVIEKAQVYDSLTDALADCHFVAATTARARGLSLPTITPRALASQASQRGAAKVAVLFGRESSGLTTDEVAQAQAIISVPLNPDFSSLNLAQAVLLVAYEWYQSNHQDEIAPSSQQPAAKQKAFDNLMNRLEQRLDETDFLALEDRRPTVVRNMRALFSKAHLTDQEIQMLHGIFRALQERS